MGAWNVSRHEVKLILMSGFYLSLNFVPLLMPLLIAGEIYYKHWWCRVVIVISVIDFLIPLRPGAKGYWEAFCIWTDTSKGLHSYNDAEIFVEGNYEKDKNYLLCYFPHALFGHGGVPIHHFLQDNYGIRFFFTVADVIFYVPILRRIMTWWGCVSVSSRALKKNLQLPYPHNVIMLQPDGIAGMFYGINHEQILLNRRRGFCRIALETGASLVPCYVFGANQQYRRRWGPNSIAARLSKTLRVSLIYWSDRYGVPFGCVPFPVKLVVAMGAPIPVTKTDKPTKEQIDALHEAFVRELKDIYSRYKHKMGAEWQTHDKLYLENEMPPRRPKID